MSTVFKRLNTPNNSSRGFLFIEAGSSGKGGSFVSLLQILRLLAGDGYRLFVILWNDSPFIEHYQSLGAQVKVLSHPFYTNHRRISQWVSHKIIALSRRICSEWLPWIELVLQWRCYKAVVHFSRRNNICLLHLNNQPIRNFLGFWVAKKLGLPVVCHARTLHGYGWGKAYESFIRKINFRFIAVSQAVASYWEKQGIPSDRIHVMHNPYDGELDSEILAHAEQPSTRAKKIVFLGRVEKAKGVDHLIVAFKKVIGIVPELSLTIIGDGDAYDDMVRFSASLDLAEKIQFLGYRYNAKNQLREYDILVLPSAQEGFGRVLIEAMAIGVAVIATRVGGMSEIITDHWNGLLVPYGDIQALSDALVELIAQPVLIKRIRQNGYQTVKDRFCEQMFYEKLLLQYQTLLSSNYDVILVISDLGCGGTQRVISHLVDRWHFHQKRMAVITFHHPHDDFFTLPDGVDRYVIDQRAISSHFISRLIVNINRVRQLRQYFKQFKSPVVIGFIGPTNILTILAAVFLKLRVIIAERNDPAKQSLGTIWDMLRRRLYRYADIVTANSPGAIHTLSTYVPVKKLRYLQNPIVIESQSKSILLSQPTLLAVGRLHFQKGYDILLNAFAEFCRLVADWQLIIIGDGPLRESLQQQARDQGIAERVQWLGYLKDPFPYYRAARLLVMPSRYEGTPNVLLEAMAQGLPAVISDSLSGSLEYVRHGETGWVVPSEDARALTEALQYLSEHETLLATLAMNAQKIMENYSSNMVNQAWDSLLQC